MRDMMACLEKDPDFNAPMREAIQFGCFWLGPF